LSKRRKRKNQIRSKEQVKTKEPAPATLQRHWPEITILIIILAIAVIRYRLLSVPLERDEGEYAYMGQLLLQGILPYAEAYNMKFPGIYFAYALVLAIFGQTHIGIHLALLIINAAAIFLIYLLGKNLFDSLTGVLAGISYGVISLSPWYLGLWANSEHFVVPFAVGGIVLLIKSLQSNKAHLLFWSGILLGLSFAVKQHAILFILFAAGYFIVSCLRKDDFSLYNLSKKSGILILGIIIPVGLLLLIFAFGGAFDKFWFWTFEYASTYVSRLSLSYGLTQLQKNISPGLQLNLPIWCTAAIGLSSPFWDRKARSQWVFSSGFFLASFIALSLGFYFRRHYFTLLMPSIALLSAIGIVALGRIISRSLSPKISTAILLLTIVAAFSYPLFAQKKLLFQLTPFEVCRTIYSVNPFPESLEIAHYIKKNTSINDRIVVIGSEPQIYFYARRRGATGYVYTYALMESHPFALEMQKEMIQEVKEAKPKYMVFVGVPTSWLRTSRSNSLIFEWLNSYIIKHYEVVGAIDILSLTETLYLWGEKAKGYTLRSNCNLSVYKRTK
jgi:hypothetical protein